jgi:hypothetical protein
MGGGQVEIETLEADRREAYHASRGTKEDCSCATEGMGAGEGEEGHLINNAFRGQFP